MDAAADFVAESVSRLLASYRFHFTEEKGLQDGIERVLDQSGFVREWDLSPHGRIDFYSQIARVGIEVKVKGGPSAVLEQLMGYAQHQDISSLILVTSRIKLGNLPPTMNGKRLFPVTLWANGL